MDLSKDEIARYQRHLSLAGFGPEAQLKLKRSRVLVVGAGGLGCPALLYLAAAGVGRIGIVDGDRVDVSNLQRQVLYGTADAGQLKAEAAARRLRDLNPFIALDVHAERFTRENALRLLADYDLVVDGTDNFGTRYLINDACVLANKPLVYGAIQGFEGQVSVFNWNGGPTYRCLFPEPPDPGTVPNCADAGVLGVLPGLIGTMQACEAIKLLTGIGTSLSGRLWMLDALSMTTHTLKLQADPRSREIRELPPEGYGEVCAVPAKSTASPEETDAETVREKLARNETAVQLIDVREGWERDLGAIYPSAHVPLGDLENGNGAEAVAKLDPKRETIVYCASGRRSLRGAALLREKYGFRSVVSLRGGYKGWASKT